MRLAFAALAVWLFGVLVGVGYASARTTHYEYMRPGNIEIAKLMSTWTDTEPFLIGDYVFLRRPAFRVCIP